MERFHFAIKDPPLSSHALARPMSLGTGFVSSRLVITSSCRPRPSWAGSVETWKRGGEDGTRRSPGTRRQPLGFASTVGFSGGRTRRVGSHDRPFLPHSAKPDMAPPRCAETPRSYLRQTLLPLRGVPEFRSAGDRSELAAHNTDFFNRGIRKAKAVSCCRDRFRHRHTRHSSAARP